MSRRGSICLELARTRNVQATSVPVIDVCGELIVGFQPRLTETRLERLLEGSTVPCQQSWSPSRSNKDGEARPRRPSTSNSTVLPMNSLSLSYPSYLAPDIMLVSSTEEDPEIDTALPDSHDNDSAATEDEIDVPVLGTLSASQLGLPLFTLLIGLVDGFNPCAMWVLVFLLSVLVNLRSQPKMIAVAGTFVAVVAWLTSPLWRPGSMSFCW